MDAGSIIDVAASLGLPADRVVPWGPGAAKVTPAHDDHPSGRLVLVSAMTPTPAGEGKTTVSIGLADGLRRLGTRVALALREPSMGPVFGSKGGGTGGGRAHLVPEARINLHFTGDLHAVTSAHNLLAALVDHHLHQGNALGLEDRTVRWPRVLDVGDRSLRHVIVGLGGRADGVPRETGFHITAASEVMAVLSMARDGDDLVRRLGRLLIGRRRGSGQAVTAQDLGAVGAMAALLEDALQPNLVCTAEGTPAFVHAGPFANIAQGTNSVIATRLALSHADVVVTEAGFGFDLGGEKLLDLKAPVAGVAPSVVVIVATLRALKAHGGAERDGWQAPDAAALEAGLPNLLHHVAVARSVGVPVVVALNRFDGDTAEEEARVRAACEAEGATVGLCDAFARGGEGAEDLAQRVREALATAPQPAAVPVFQVAGDSALENLERVCTRVYGADGVDLTDEAQDDWKAAEALGMDRLPVCIAKTAASLTDDPTVRGRPTGFRITVRGIGLSAGAGFLVPVTGETVLMPGMPKVPAALRLRPSWAFDEA